MPEDAAAVAVEGSREVEAGGLLQEAEVLLEALAVAVVDFGLCRYDMQAFVAYVNGDVGAVGYVGISKSRKLKSWLMSERALLKSRNLEKLVLQRLALTLRSQL